METSVDTLVYQLEDDDTNVRWNTLQKLRKIAAVETSHFPVRNTRRFLQCIRRRIVGEGDPHVAIEALRLLADVMLSLGDSVDQILSSILPHLIPILPQKRRNREQDDDSEDELETLHEEMFQVFRKYTNVSNDLQAVADLLVNIGLGSGHGSKHAVTARGESTKAAIGRGDKALIVALVQAIIPSLEDSNEKVVVAAEEAIAKLQSYWGSRFSTDVMKFLSSEDKQTLHEHREPIADFVQAYQLHFGFLNADIVTALTTNTTNSNADWKKRAAAVEKLYAACKQVDAGVLRGLNAEERLRRMNELENLFHILNENDFDIGECNDHEASNKGQKDAAYYMTQMLVPMVETSANFAGEDDEMEGFVYALLSQVFESGCVRVSGIEQVLAATSLRHRRSRVREEALKVWMVLILIAERERLLSAKYVPSENAVQTLGRLLGDTNALTTSPERARHDIQKPRKKPIKPKDTARTDEVDTKARPLGKQDPRYLELHEITPLMNPKQDLSKILTQLRSEDWEANFDAMNTVRRLAIHHAGMIDLSKVHGIVAEILKQVPNLRSSVSKNALLALESMCSAFSRAMDSEVENIIPVLLKRAQMFNVARSICAGSSPRGVYAVIVCQADSISTSKDLPSILQLVGRCLEDSNNECMSGERIKRLLPAAAQTKVDSLLPLAAKQHETIAASARLKKTAKQHSRRPTPPTSRNVTRSNINADEVSRLETKLDSSNWKDRFDALNETTDFIRGSASALVGSSQMLSLFDQLIKRLDDGNAKVNVLALECMEKIVPAVGTGMEQVLSNFVPAIAKNLANARTSSLAQSVVQQLCTHADNRSLCQHFAIQARNTNSRVLPVVLDTLAQLTAQSCDDKNNYVLNRHVLPLALGLLKEAKSDVKEANAKLLCQLSRTLGLATLSSAASKLSSSQQDKLAAILR
uniref:TOG domain-containing protein n=1 Tax=Phytophthora ramorum TaxID=164328 RepID=H3HAM4_PHYRM